MSRHRSGEFRRSYGHRIRRLDSDTFRLTWTVDRYYPNSRLRHPTGYAKITDAAGAKRFAKRWEIAMPPEPQT